MKDNHTWVICAYGESDYLEACIQSLKNHDKIEESVKEQLAASKEGDLNYRHYAALLRNVQKIKEGYYGKDADTRSSDK